MTSARSLASFHRSGSDIFKKNVRTPNQCANYHLKLYNSVLFINSFCNINSHAVERFTEFDKRNALCAGMLLNGLGCFLLNFWFLMPCQFSLFEYTGNQSQRNHLVMDHGSPGKTASTRKKHFFAYLCLDTGTGAHRR